MGASISMECQYCWSSTSTRRRRRRPKGAQHANEPGRPKEAAYANEAGHANEPSPVQKRLAKSLPFSMAAAAAAAESVPEVPRASFFGGVCDASTGVAAPFYGRSIRPERRRGADDGDGAGVGGPPGGRSRRRRPISEGRRRRPMAALAVVRTVPPPRVTGFFLPSFLFLHPDSSLPS